MYIYIYRYTYIYTYVCIHYVYIYVYIMYLYISTYVYMYTCMCMYHLASSVVEMTVAGLHIQIVGELMISQGVDPVSLINTLLLFFTSPFSEILIASIRWFFLAYVRVSFVRWVCLKIGTLGTKNQSCCIVSLLFKHVNCLL